MVKMCDKIYVCSRYCYAFAPGDVIKLKLAVVKKTIGMFEKHSNKKNLELSPKSQVEIVPSTDPDRDILRDPRIVQRIEKAKQMPSRAATSKSDIE
jgi:hypothetical protein